MRTRFKRALLLCAGLLLPGLEARADASWEVTVDSPALAAIAATLAFDLIDGGAPGNNVVIEVLASDGTLVSTSSVGDVSGSGPWRLGDASFFNELLMAFDPFGSSLVFRFTATDLPPANGSFPDAFSMFVLAPDLLSFLVTTDDPTGANALFLLNMGEGPGVLTLYSPLETGVAVTVVLVRDVTEPATTWLVAGALVGMLALRRRRAPG